MGEGKDIPDREVVFGLRNVDRGFNGSELVFNPQSTFHITDVPNGTYVMCLIGHYESEVFCKVYTNKGFYTWHGLCLIIV